jgi:hypothetical protein
MPDHPHPDPSTNPAPETQAVSGGSLRSRISSAVLGNLLRVVRVLRRVVEGGGSPNF